MSCKRSCKDQDPDYEDDLTKDQKRLRLIEKYNQEATVKKIEKIIEVQFAQEMKNKETEIDNIDERIYEARQMLDQLRTGQIISYYSFEGSNETVALKSSETKVPIHPAVKKLLGRFPASTSGAGHGKLSSNQPQTENAVEATEVSSSRLEAPNDVLKADEPCDESSRGGRFREMKRIIIGNLSKYIPVDQRENTRDLSSHKWMIYVRGPKEDPVIHTFVSKVVFFLDPSYKPNDIVEITQPPFHLTRRGWGEFPVRVQLHFRDARNKYFDVFHTLSLDKTCTGIQTLGVENVVEVPIYKDGKVIPTVKDLPTPCLYPIPSDVGGISIPADVQPENSQQKQQPESEKSSTLLNSHFVSNDVGQFEAPKCDVEKVVKIKQEMADSAYDDVQGSCAVSSFINDHGTYVNSTVKSESHAYHQNLGSKKIIIKQEPFEFQENTDDILTPPNEKRLTLVKMSSVINSQSKTSSILRKEIGNHKINSLPPGKATIVLNKTSPAAVSILNIKAKLPQNVKNNSSFSSSSIPTVKSSSTLLNISSSNDTKTINDVKQKLQGGNGVPKYVKCVDRQGNYYYIPLTTFCTMSPSVRATLVGGETNADSISGFTVKTEEHSKSNSHSETSSQTPSISGVCKLKRTNSVNKQMTHNAIVSNNNKISNDFQMSLNIDDFKDFKHLVRHLVKKFPLVKPNSDRTSYPYCANTLDAFLGWNVGKRHSAEWHRAKDVRGKLLELTENSTRWKPLDVWTVKQIYIWLRHHGYTPMRNDFEQVEDEGEDGSSLPVVVNTFTECCEMLQDLACEQKRIVEAQPEAFKDEVEEEIDVTTVEEKPKCCVRKNVSPETFAGGNSVLRLPLDEEGIIVQEAAHQIGIYFQPEEVCQHEIQGEAQGDEEEKVYVPLAETALLTAVKLFLEDVLSLSVAEKFKKTDSKRCPSCITVNDVVAAICNHPEADFLTNRGLGAKINPQHFLSETDMKL